MKNHRVVAGVLFALLIIVLSACGGGGGGGGTTGYVGPITSIRLEAIVEGTSTVVDPSNIFVNEQVRFRLTGIDEGTIGQPRIVLPSGAWTLTGTPGGTLASDGLFSANSTPTGFFGTAKATFESINYTSSVRVVAPEAIMVGHGRLTNGNPTPNVQIQALNSSGTVVATGLVGADGTIRMSVPTTAVAFTTAFPSDYYVRQFSFAGKDYATTVNGCFAPLPTFTLGQTTSMSTDVVFYSTFDTSPPPPPDGCS
ncbi:MAG: hypothetical protein JST12_17895 [Armatimonadetes bacterium]|nr:hypothetical protein [Armatimonadota bacterium]MBS1703542.1 hypothetical protein [Armatimonadota bacterium]MBS1729017.1 hypothetical protein [Armatimonadota bacterium]